MSSIVALMLLSATPLTPAAAESADAKAELANIKKLFAERDLIPLQRQYYISGIGRIKNLPPACRNEVALLAAHNLSLGKYRQGLSDKEIWPTLTGGTRPELNRQWGINNVAANILRELSEHRLTTERKVLPFLIEALAYPDSGFRRQAYHSLYYLTKRRVGDDVWGRGIIDAAREPGFRAWWLDWWQANKDRNPIYTAEVETKVKKRVEEIYRKMDAELAPKFNELFGLKTFDYRTHIHPTSRVVGEIDYAPGRRAYIALPKGVNGPINFNKLPRIQVEARFATPNPKEAAPKEKRLPKENKIEVVHRELLPGTDIEIRVLAATPNADLTRALRDLFQPGDRSKK
jgi:hypothetical protein